MCVFHGGGERPHLGQGVVRGQHHVVRVAQHEAAQEVVRVVQVAVDKAAAMEEDDQARLLGARHAGRVDARAERILRALHLDVAYLQRLARSQFSHGAGNAHCATTGCTAASSTVSFRHNRATLPTSWVRAL